MGNSGSTHQSISDGEHQNLPPWTQSTSIHHQQIKVLPELKEEPRLRPTNNGTILLHGGSISGRKDSAGSGTKCSPTSDQHIPHVSLDRRPMMMRMQRSRTQVDMIVPGRSTIATSTTNLKRFGSEPDIMNMDNDHKDTNNNSSRAIMQKTTNKNGPMKKKKAPPIPDASRSMMTGTNRDFGRFGWKPPPPPPNRHEPPNDILAAKEPPKKLRLFKTKAESSKKMSSEMLAHPLSCADHFQFSEVRIHNRSSSGHDPIPDRERNHSKDPKINEKLSGIPKFRREKSFDLNLLRASTNPLSNLEIAPLNRSIDHRNNSTECQKVMRPGHGKLESSTSVGVMKPAQSISEFQKELLEATRRRSMVIDNGSPSDYMVRSMSMAPQSFNPTVPKDTIYKVEKNTNEYQSNFKADNSRKNSEPDEQPQSMIGATKTFYFGMDTSANDPKSFQIVADDDIDDDEVNDNGPSTDLVQKIQMDEIDKFAESLLKKKRTNCRTNGSGSESSESALSSTDYDEFLTQHHLDGHIPDDVDTSTNTTKKRIQLMVRPTLPRRQYEIPRFSPAAAWKTLAQTDDKYNRTKDYKHLVDCGSYSSYDDGHDDLSNTVVPAGVFEERIERIYREPVPGFLDNKSGDSGISGDACLPEIVTSGGRRGGGGGDAGLTSNGVVEENPCSKSIGPFLPSWTPQQDLDEDSSSDGDGGGGGGDRRGNGGEVEPISKDDLSKYHSNGHMFSLSLPRESHLGSYTEQLHHSKQTFNSLQRLRRTVSGAFGQQSMPDTKLCAAIQNDNWLLSRSAPNSIDNCDFSTGKNSLNESSLTTGGGGSGGGATGAGLSSGSGLSQCHTIEPNKSLSSNENQAHSLGYFTSLKYFMYLPSNAMECKNSLVIQEDEESDLKFMEPHDEEVKSSGFGKENLQDPVDYTNSILSAASQHYKTRGHRFTFQSTIRQIERRRLAERLSKEAEQKEAQRYSELEAMRRVEEEFQKKRAREKASIRQQLRLYSMGENITTQYSSLQSEWQPTTFRAEPDGAVASPTSSTSSPHHIISRSATDAEFIDTKTPYISKLIKKKSGKFADPMCSKSIDFR